MQDQSTERTGPPGLQGPTYKQGLHRVLIPFAALLATLPLLLHGPSCGHDLSFHILSWLEAAGQLKHGGYPHWAFTPAWNAGEPRFLFYPPLSWMLGAVLGMILPWVFIPAAFTWCSFTLSGFLFHRLARTYAVPPVATVIALLYLLNPYMLFVAYERTAYAELLAAAWFPLLFLAAFAPQVSVLAVAVPIALLWLTNVPAAIMGSYALAFLLILRLIWDTPRGRRLPQALNASAGALLGLALAGIYLVPAVYERNLISSNLALVPGLDPRTHFLFSHMPAGPNWDFHNAVVHSASVVAVILLATCAATFAFAWRQQRRLSLLMGSLTLLIFLLLLPASLPVWDHLPELRFLQFPWRLSALLATSAAVLLTLALGRARRMQPIRPVLVIATSLLLAVLCVLPAWSAFRQSCDEEDNVPAQVALYHDNAGIEATDEYTPEQADGDALKEGDPGYWLLPLSAPEDAAPPPGATPGQAPTHLTLNLPAPQVLVLNRRAYPIWQVRVNRRPVPVTDERTDGLIAVELPAGASTVDLIYHRPPEVVWGILLSLFAVALLLTLWAAGSRKENLATLKDHSLS